MTNGYLPLLGDADHWEDHGKHCETCMLKQPRPRDVRFRTPRFQPSLYPHNMLINNLLLSYGPICPRVLIVEDNPIQAQLLTVLVRQMGLCPLGPVASAAAALELCRQHWPELAILDVHLHGDTDGIELARRLQQLGQLPLLFLSGAEDAHTLGQLEQMQPLAFLPKPYQYADLQHIITQGLALGGAGGGPPGTRARPPDPRVL